MRPDLAIRLQELVEWRVGGRRLKPFQKALLSESTWQFFFAKLLQSLQLSSGINLQMLHMTDGCLRAGSLSLIYSD